MAPEPNIKKLASEPKGHPGSGEAREEISELAECKKTCELATK